MRWGLLCSREDRKMTKEDWRTDLGDEGSSCFTVKSLHKEAQPSFRLQVSLFGLVFPFFVTPPFSSRYFIFIFETATDYRNCKLVTKPITTFSPSQTWDFC